MEKDTNVPYDWLKETVQKSLTQATIKNGRVRIMKLI